MELRPLHSHEAHLQGVVDQADLDKGIGLLAVAPELGQQQNIGDGKVE